MVGWYHCTAPHEYESFSVVDPDPYVFKPPGSGSVIICWDPDPSINKQKKESK